MNLNLYFNLTIYLNLSMQNLFSAQFAIYIK